MAVIFKKISTKFPDVQVLYYRDERYSCCGTDFMYDYGGLIVGNRLEAYSHFLDNSEALKDLSLTAGEPFQVVNKRASSLLRERFLESLFYNGSEGLAEEWYDICSEKELDEIKASSDKNEFAEKNEPVIKSILYSFLQNNFDFCSFMETLTLNWLVPSEEFIESLFTKADVSTNFAYELHNLYNNKLWIHKILGIYFCWDKMLSEYHDPCSNLSCWRGMVDAIQGKKTFKVKIKGCDKLFSLPSESIFQKEEDYPVHFKDDMFGPLGIDVNHCPLEIALAIRANFSFSPAYYSYQALEYLSYRNTIIWENPNGGENP